MAAAMPDWLHPSAQATLGLAVILGYPILTLAALEFARVFGERRQFAADVMRQTALLLLPAGAVWLVLRGLAGMPKDDWAVRTTETVFALTGLYLVLRVAQAVLLALTDNTTQAPKLLLDLLRIGVSIGWGAVVVSSIWNVDLASLFAAMGVGSIVLGFALQEFLGNLLSGLGLLSAHKFGVGDWIVVDGGPAQVLEMDWRTVTLAKGGNQVVVANSTLAKGNLVIAARAGAAASASVMLTFGVETPPEQVREAVLEAGAKCSVTGIADGVISYAASFPVASPGVLSGPRDEFLSRFWYVAQRRGLPLDAGAERKAPLLPGADDRLGMLAASGAFHGDMEALPVLARSSAFRRYRRADTLLAAGDAAAEAFLVLNGALAVSVPTAQGQVPLETVGRGELLVLSEMLAGGVSSVAVVADQNTDVLAIPALALHEVMDASRVIARDIHALAEARRLAIQPLSRGLRSVA